MEVQELSLTSLSTSVGTRLARHEDQTRLLRALRRLPLDEQLLLETYYWHEMNRAELAEVFDVETATIGSRLFRARESLAATLGGDGRRDG